MILAGRRLQKLEETAAQVRALGGSKVLTVQTDLVIDGDVENLFAQATKTFGRLPDVVLSNAGVVEDDLVPAGEHDVEAWWNIVVSKSVRERCANLGFYQLTVSSLNRAST